LQDIKIKRGQAIHFIAEAFLLIKEFVVGNDIKSLVL
jgi:hypothetical protein